MLRSTRERMIQTAAYEVSGVLLAAPLYGVLFGAPAAESFWLVAAMSVAVMMWVPLHNCLFDRLDLRLTGRCASDRPHGLRAFHALSLEVTTMVLTLPIIMAVGGHGFLDGIALDIGFTLFYAGYAYVFFICYDQLRPLKVERQAGPEAAAAVVLAT